MVRRKSARLYHRDGFSIGGEMGAICSFSRAGARNVPFASLTGFMKWPPLNFSHALFVSKRLFLQEVPRCTM
jgi:hypothetical protein